MYILYVYTFYILVSLEEVKIVLIGKKLFYINKYLFILVYPTVNKNTYKPFLDLEKIFSFNINKNTKQISDFKCQIFVSQNFRHICCLEHWHKHHTHSSYLNVFALLIKIALIKEVKCLIFIYIVLLKII